MLGTLSTAEEAQLMQTIEMFEVITQSQPHDYQSLEILKEAYFKLGRQKDVIATSKRIAQAYVQLGQLSSAILEYETILQRYPDDPDVLAAMAEIESKANSLSSSSPSTDTDLIKNGSPASSRKPAGRVAEIDDGRQMMYKLFVEGKIITAAEFDVCWFTPSIFEPPNRVIEPFVQVIADRGISPIEKSLKMISDKSRLAYMPLEKYDIDSELARSFPKDACQRWCVLPFDRMSKSIFVATANPFNKQAADELQSVTGNRIVWYLSSPVELQKLIKKLMR